MEIRRKGYDDFYVNNDFMMATYHDLLKGILAIGQSYYVVFMQRKDGSWVRFPAGGEMAADMIMREFARAGLSTETLPVVKGTQQNTKK